MFTLVVDAENRKLYTECEVVYENGSVRTLKCEANKSIRVDFDQLYSRGQSLPPPV